MQTQNQKKPFSRQFINSVFTSLTLLILIAGFQNCGSFEAASLNNGTQILIDPDNGETIGVLSSPKSKIRLLNGSEYSQTMESLTGTETSSQFSHADQSTGFDTGDRTLVDPSLFSSFLLEGEKAAEDFVDNKLDSSLFSCFRANDLSKSCAREIISSLAEKAYRKTPSSEEINSLYSLYDRLRGLIPTSEELTPLKMTLTKIMSSPQFLYKSEIGARDSSGEIVLTDFEKASMISYALTGTSPDEELFQDAKKGELNEDKLRSHIRRILKTPLARQWVTRFFSQWLQLDSLRAMKREPEQFLKLSNLNQAEALNEEFDLFIRNLVFENEGTVEDLLLSQTTYVNRDIASLYGMNISSRQFTSVDLPQERSGVLTLASVMSSHASDLDRESDQPVSRGVLIKGQFLCEDIGLPSGLDVGTAAENALKNIPNFDDLPVRSQYEIIMQQAPSCVACHAQFMPYGYMFSQFNALGEFKTRQKGRNINARVDAFIDEDSRSYDGPKEFMKDLASSKKYHRCFSEKLAQFFIGNSAETIDGNLNQLFYLKLKKGDLKITTLIEEALSDSALLTRRRTE